VKLQQVEVLMGQGMPQIGLDVMMDGSSWLMQSATALRVISSKGAVKQMRTSLCKDSEAAPYATPVEALFHTSNPIKIQRLARLCVDQILTHTRPQASGKSTSPGAKDWLRLTTLWSTLV
jgi:hypothetical protein